MKLGAKSEASAINKTRWSGLKKSVAGARRLRRFSVALQIYVEAG